MADSQQAAASQVSSQQEILDLQDELGFQKVLLKSIDETVFDHENAAQQVTQEIAQLEKRLKVLKRGTRTTASSSSHTSSSKSSQVSHTSLSKKTPTKKRSDQPSVDGEANSMNGYSREPWRAQAPLDSTASTPNSHSTESFPELIPPSQMSLPSRKRTHSSHLDGGLAPYSHGDNKSRRTSPSPYTASPATPSGASSGYGYGYPMIGDGFFDLTMEEEFAAFDDFFQQQKAAESRIERERADAELARSLQDDGFAMVNQPSISGLSAFDRLSGVAPQASNSSFTNTPSSSARTAFDRMSAVRQESNPSAATSSNREDAHSASSRKLPPGWNNGSSLQPSQYRPVTQYRSVKAEVPSMASGVNTGSHYGPFQNQGSSTTSFIPASKVKAEQKYSMPGSFRDDSSTASDSDIEVIPASAFRANGRQPITSASQRPGYSPESQATGDAALRRVGQAASNSALQQALYGNQQLPNWMNAQAGPAQPFGSTMLPGPSMGMGRVPGQYVYPSAYTPYSGMGMAKQEGGLGYHVTPDGTISLDDDLDFLAPGQQSYGANMPGFNFNEQMAEQYDYIVNDPRKTHAEIKSLLENIRPDLDLPAENREGTPAGLKYPLYEHQKLALTWLKSMEQGTNKGGILADDMGLGKTISALALILSRPSNDRAHKTTLVVGPVALVRQWEREIKHKINGSHKLSSYLVHGQQKKLSWDDLRTYDVVLTTYGTLAAEAKRMEKYLEKEKKAGRHDIDQNPMKKLFPLLGPKSLFYRVFLDEAQCIKNKNTQSARAACTIKSTYRFCLTGTPMMNNVGELYSLIHFLRIKPYNEYQRFQSEFGMLTKGNSGKRDTNNAMRKLQTVLKAILLRRTKQSQIDGKPIITLPQKSTEIQHVVFSEAELEFYQSLESKTQIQFNKYLRQGTIGKNYSNILVLLLRLRQVCCHPHLIMDFDAAPPGGEALTLDILKELAESLQPEVVKRLLEEESEECPVCLDGNENPSIIVPCGHSACSECLAKVITQAAQDGIADGNEGGGQAKCPHCRGKLEAGKVTDLRSFNKVHNPQAVDDEETVSEVSDSDDETDSETEDESDDADSDGDLRGFVVPDDIEETEDEDEANDEDDNEGDDEAEVEPKPKKSSKSKKKSSKGKKKDKKGKGKAQKEKKPHLSLAMLKKEASRSAEGRRRYMRYLRKNWEPSAKVTKCVELLEQFQEEGEKTIIFSQFVSLLDLLQVPIDQKGWNMERYDGSMSGEARHSAIMRFTDKPNCKIMLISLKAGNAGLNLVAASRVIILDPFWNPYIEMQAVDRAYRIGQQKAVQVHRILVEKTVEDRIIELQEQKRKLVDSALDEGANKSLGRLDNRQLAFLFGVQQ